MSKSFARTRAFFGTVGAVIAVAGAVDAHHRPADKALRGAGIDPKAFDAIAR